MRKFSVCFTPRSLCVVGLAVLLGIMLLSSLSVAQMRVEDAAEGAEEEIEAITTEETSDEETDIEELTTEEDETGELDALPLAAIEVRINSRSSWQSTGVRVTSGQPYGVWQTRGTWTVDQRNFAFVSGAGYSPQTDAGIFQGCKINRSWPYGLLIGRIGSSVFPIGRGRSFRAPQNGILELSIHDNANCLGDNAGTLNVKVEPALTVHGVLKRVADALRINLTTAERQRLTLLIRDISACAGPLAGGVISEPCGLVILGLLSFVYNPEPAE